MRLTLEIEGKYVAIEIGDAETDDTVYVGEDQHVVLPFGFHNGPEEGEPVDDSTPEVDCY